MIFSSQKKFAIVFSFLVNLLSLYNIFFSIRIILIGGILKKLGSIFSFPGIFLAVVLDKMMDSWLIMIGVFFINIIFYYFVGLFVFKFFRKK